jgi:hypothetical protein
LILAGIAALVMKALSSIVCRERLGLIMDSKGRMGKNLSLLKEAILTK